MHFDGYKANTSSFSSFVGSGIMNVGLTMSYVVAMVERNY